MEADVDQINPSTTENDDHLSTSLIDSKSEIDSKRVK